MTDDQTRKSSGAADDQSDLDPRIEEIVSGSRQDDDRVVDDRSQIVDDEAEELLGEPVPDETPGRADPEDMVVDDPQQLADAEQVAARARSSRPVRRTQAKPSVEHAHEATTQQVAARPAPAPRPVRRQSPASPSEKQGTRAAAGTLQGSRRTTPAAFISQSGDELRKVIWPTGAQLSQYFVVVLLFVLFIVAYVGLLDPAFGWVVLKLLGN